MYIQVLYQVIILNLYLNYLMGPSPPILFSRNQILLKRAVEILSFKHSKSQKFNQIFFHILRLYLIYVLFKNFTKTRPVPQAIFQ